MNFCSRAALAGEARLAGTGVRGDAYVFLPVAKQLWGASEMNHGWASEAELDAVRRARRGGVVTRLYDPRPQASPPEVLVHEAPGAAPADELVALLALFGRRWAVEETPAPRFAVCTHGTRDRCCAKWGFAVYREALRLFREGRSPFQPVECSHLGGDRYAATGVFFPSGGMYGHLEVADVEAVTAAEAADTLLPAKYRGRVFEAEAAQVVRAGLARDGLATGATTPLAMEQTRAGELRVETSAGAFAVSLATEETRFYPSCAAMDRGRLSRSRRLVYAGARRLGGG